MFMGSQEGRTLAQRQSNKWKESRNTFAELSCDHQKTRERLLNDFKSLPYEHWTMIMRLSFVLRKNVQFLEEDLF